MLRPTPIRVALSCLLASASAASADALAPLDFSHCPSPVIRTPVDAVDGVGTATNTNPYDVVISPDGQWVYVSFMQPPPGHTYRGGVQIFANDWGLLTETVQSAKSAHQATNLTIDSRQVSGLALTNNGHTLLAAAHDSVTGTQNGDLLVYDVTNPQMVPAPLVIPIPNPFHTTSGPGSIEVRTNGTFVWVANEYNDTLTTIDLNVVTDVNGHGKYVRSTIDLAALPVTNVGGGHHPVGMAVDALNNRLYVATEGLAGVDPTKPAHNNSGSILMFDVATETPSFHGARNGGCAPARVKLDGNGHLFVAARGSDAVFAFHTGQLWASPNNPGLLGFARTGHKPLDIAFADGGNLLLVANSNRDTGNPGSMVSFYVQEVLTMNGAEASGWFSSGGGQFSRQIAVNGAFVFMTNFDSANVQYYLIP